MGDQQGGRAVARPPPTNSSSCMIPLRAILHIKRKLGISAPATSRGKTSTSPVRMRKSWKPPERTSAHLVDPQSAPVGSISHCQLLEADHAVKTRLCRLRSSCRWVRSSRNTTCTGACARSASAASTCLRKRSDPGKAGVFRKGCRTPPAPALYLRPRPLPAAPSLQSYRYEAYRMDCSRSGSRLSSGGISSNISMPLKSQPWVAAD